MDKITTKVDVHYSSLFVMDSRKTETVGEYVKRVRNEKNLTVEEVSNNSGRKADGKNAVSRSYVNKLENEGGNVTAPYLKALAKGLGVPEEEIFAVASGRKLGSKEA